MPKMCPEEHPIELVLNGNAIATFQLTKADLEDWAVGYLYAEGIIEGLDDVKDIFVQEGRVDVTLYLDWDPIEWEQKRKHFTAGCGRGVTFFSMTDVKQFPKVASRSSVNLSYLLKMRNRFSKQSPMYIETGGMHGACLLFDDEELIVREDIGRHNAVDKVIGYAIRNGLLAQDLVLMTTGRISYEMLAKAARFGFSIIGSRTAATKQAVQLANFLGIEVVGYMRGKMATVYTKQNLVIDDLQKTVTPIVSKNTVEK
ncbi:formate dehydrogenase accessory sulfurtransferase FdhD [Texcoconibacillus texcoconensis]|uniref:Sulfur carrier protein FdhD n=1 Tax=Texcoconibacillus texcoconensis TaxID=1095777 RepID=A0A840QNA6_9BACI|nr:formate dehydrogenase accessory sulfurtransferase FdhD [Texcoconibacillus texcoconensis]MBB5172838.1 FdhD protein [Texcoconibacillus texcoconensis]